MRHNSLTVRVFVFSLVAGCQTQVTGGLGGADATSSSSGSGGTAGMGGTSSTGTAGAAGSGGSGGSGGMVGSSSSSSSGGGCGFCDFTCCGSLCANTGNDIKNCGGCGIECPGSTPFCDNGKCAATPPCNGPLCGPGGTCCGSNCCAVGELCCSVPGPIAITLGCFAPNAAGTCPTGCTSCECTSPDTPIATPSGERPIESLVEGDLVYSVHQGALMAVPIRARQRIPVTDHVVVHVELVNGRVLDISPRHPTADGRAFADLSTGGTLDGQTIANARSVPYRHAFTYDILPDSDTGTYVAAGALIGSTMAKASANVVGGTNSVR